MTLYISAIDETSIKALKAAFIYLLISLFCILFGAIYEVFSHEVYSFYMIYAFIFPLAGGVLPFLKIALSNTGVYPGIAARIIYNSGIATLTVGSILRGILDIYGTSNHLLIVYWIAGTALTIVGAMLIKQWSINDLLYRIINN